MSWPSELLHYKMNDDAANTTVLDSAAGGNNGTLTGAGNTSGSTVAGKIDKALSFDGSNDYILTSDFTGLGTNVDKSIAFWLYKPSEAAQYDRYLIKSKNSTALGFQFIRGENSREGIVFNDGVEILYGLTGFGTGSWTHVVMTYTEATATIGAYVNGSSASNAGAIGTSYGFDANNNLNIGGRAAGAQFPVCYFDDFRIYNAVLTAEQVTALYNSGNGTELSLVNLEPVISSIKSNKLSIGLRIGL